jgi:hypothetical protein
MIWHVKTGLKGIALTGRLARVLFTAVVGCGSAFAEDVKAFDANAYPAGVQKILQSARDECKAEGGGEVQFAADTVRMLDLTGPGRNDYIIDLRNVECPGREGAYCGTGGCELSIVATLPVVGTRLVFQQQVRDYEVLPGSGARTIRFTLHGGYCGGHGNPSCIKTHRITSQPFKFTMPK